MVQTQKERVNTRMDFLEKKLTTVTTVETTGYLTVYKTLYLDRRNNTERADTRRVTTSYVRGRYPEGSSTEQGQTREEQEGGTEYPPSYGPPVTHGNSPFQNPILDSTHNR